MHAYSILGHLVALLLLLWMDFKSFVTDPPLFFSLFFHKKPKNILFSFWNQLKDIDDTRKVNFVQVLTSDQHQMIL